MNEQRITQSPSWSDLRGQVMKTPDDVAGYPMPATLLHLHPYRSADALQQPLQAYPAEGQACRPPPSGICFANYPARKA